MTAGTGFLQASFGHRFDKCLGGGGGMIKATLKDGLSSLTEGGDTRRELPPMDNPICVNDQKHAYHSGEPLGPIDLREMAPARL